MLRATLRAVRRRALTRRLRDRHVLVAVTVRLQLDLDVDLALEPVPGHACSVEC